MATSKSVTWTPSQQHLFGPNKTECDTHGQQLRSYCPSHLMPCCGECISQSHSKCTGITSLASVVEKTNIEKSKESVGNDINSILNFLDKLAHNKSENIQRGEKQYQNIKASISEIKIEINKHLENLEKKLCKEADTIWGQQKSKLTDFIKEVEEQKKRLKETQDDLRTVQAHTSKLQLFLGLHQIEQQVHQCQRYVDEQNETVIEIEITLKKMDEVAQTFSKVQSLTSLGEVEVDETEITLRKETSVGKEAQIVSQPKLNNMTMNIETKIHTNLENIINISDMICLTDGRFIIVEKLGSVNILTLDGKFHKRLPISDGAFCVTHIKQETVAISYPNLKAIRIFNMEIETITKLITLDKSCWGLFFSNDVLAVGLNANEIRIIDLEGNTQKSIEIQSNTRLYHIIYKYDKVIYSDNLGKAVCCISASGNEIWKFQQDLSGPMGLCADSYGNIIVVDRNSDIILAISKDGQDSKVLICEADEPKVSMCFCLNGSSGFVCYRFRRGVYIKKTKLSYE